MSGRVITERSVIFHPGAMCVWLRLVGVNVSTATGEQSVGSNVSSGVSVHVPRNGRRRVALFAAAALLVGLVPASGVDAHGGGFGGHSDGTDKLLFFASDGLRQDAVEFGRAALACAGPPS